MYLSVSQKSLSSHVLQDNELLCTSMGEKSEKTPLELAVEDCIAACKRDNIGNLVEIFRSMQKFVVIG